MPTRTGLAIALSVASLFASRLAVAETSEPSIETRRANVERAEEELHLRQREEAVAAEHRALDRRAVERDKSPFSHAGRIVFPNLAGVSFMSLNTLQGAAVTGGGLIAFGTQSDTGPSGGMKGSSISFNPSVDVFVGEHLTLGGMASVGRVESASAQTQSTVGGAPAPPTISGSAGYGVALEPRIGRTFDLGPVTIWPTLSGRYRVNRTELATVGATASARSLTRAIGAVLSVDVVFPIGRYLMFSVGPTLSYEHASTDFSPSVSPIQQESDRMSGGIRAYLGVTL